MKRILWSIMGRVPDEYRPELLRAYRFARTGLTAAMHGRTFLKAERVVWLRPEVASMESVYLVRPGPTEILVRMEATLLSPGTERAFLLGLPNTSQTFPAGAGYSAAGRVEAVGRSVRGWTPGDRFAGVAPHASHAVVRPDCIVPIPDAVTSEAASFAQLGTIALQGIRRARILPGERLVVVGLGLVGQLTIQLARWAGAVPIIGLARSKTFEDFAKQSGCDDMVELDSDPDAPDRLEADVVIEATGNPEAIPTVLRAARQGGRVVLVGSPRGLTQSVDFEGWIRRRELSVIGAHISSVATLESSPGRWTRQDESSLFLELVASGQVKPHHLIEEVADPAEANKVYEGLVTSRKPIMGLVFDWRKSGHSVGTNSR